MARFPQGEPDIAVLAMRIISGLSTLAEELPNPPVPAEELRARFETYNAAMDAIANAQAAVRDLFATKDAALEELVDGMKANLKYAEVAVRHDAGKLAALGWSERKAGTPRPVPGQARSLELMAQGEGWVLLDWKAPTDGGDVAAYKVMRRRRQEGAWEEVRTAVNTEVLLREQERGVTLEFQIVAVNKTGDGTPSNIVMAVL
jgi:hypothetical protein